MPIKTAAPLGTGRLTEAVPSTPHVLRAYVTSFSRLKFSKMALYESFIFFFSSMDSNSNFFVILCSAEVRRNYMYE